MLRSLLLAKARPPDQRQWSQGGVGLARRKQREGHNEQFSKKCGSQKPQACVFLQATALAQGQRLGDTVRDIPS